MPTRKVGYKLQWITSIKRWGNDTISKITSKDKWEEKCKVKTRLHQINYYTKWDFSKLPNDEFKNTKY